MDALPKFSRPQHWYNWLTRDRTCCQICFGEGIHDYRVLGDLKFDTIVRTRGSATPKWDGTGNSYLWARTMRREFRRHVQDAHPGWMERLSWAVKRA